MVEGEAHNDGTLWGTRADVEHEVTQGPQAVIFQTCAARCQAPCLPLDQRQAIAMPGVQR